MAQPTGSHEVLVAMAVFAVTVLTFLVLRLRSKLIEAQTHSAWNEAGIRWAAEQQVKKAQKEAEFAKRLADGASKSAIHDSLVLSVAELSNEALQEYIRSLPQSCSTCGAFGLRSDECVIRQFPEADGQQLIAECNDCIAHQHTADLGIPLSALSAHNDKEWADFERSLKMNDAEYERLKQAFVGSLPN